VDRWADKDMLLNVMGYHHFHFDAAPHNRVRSDDVLFAHVTRETFTVIGIFDHAVFEVDPAKPMMAERNRLEPQPVDEHRASEIMLEVIRATEEVKPAPKPLTQETAKPPTQETAAPTAAPTDRHDIGPLSTAEHERLNTVIGDLTNRVTMQKTALDGRNNEISALRARLRRARALPCRR
jgi:hypothetical protein